MAEKDIPSNDPPKLRLTADGEPETSSVADLIEWFLTFDERTSRMRHASTDELFRWKQQDDEANGTNTFPFENAEARFAIGTIQALAENKSEPLLNMWISDLLDALQASRQTRDEITQSYGLDADMDSFPLKRSEKLTSNAEKRIYLTSCWLDALCTAEVRVLGWVYQELYGKPFAT